MKKISLGNKIEGVSQVALGCMRISNLEEKRVVELLETAIDNGINLFDHADIYGAGKSEEVFASAIKSMKVNREDLIIQSKCGIRNGFFDSSPEHIEKSVDDILKRLDIDYLDTLLIHRPDALIEPEKVAECFSKLRDAGKVKHFGVSNHNPSQIELLTKYMDDKLVANQLQFSITNAGMIDSGIYANIFNEDKSVDRDGHVLNYCRLHDITIQAWSPFLYGFFEGVFIDSPKHKELNDCLDAIAKSRGVTKTTIATAWILRHPAKIQPIVGTTNPDRLKQICEASDVELTREEWYDIYKSVGKKLP